MVIEGIIVKGVSGNNSWIKHPKMYTRTELLVDKKEIASPPPPPPSMPNFDKIKQWKYLKVFASDITQTDAIKIGILIGANCIKALESLKAISSVNGGPYTHQAKLVWCIAGPVINMVGKKSIVCNQVAMRWPLYSSDKASLAHCWSCYQYGW